MYTLLVGGGVLAWVLICSSLAPIMRRKPTIASLAVGILFKD